MLMHLPNVERYQLPNPLSTRPTWRALRLNTTGAVKVTTSSVLVDVLKDGKPVWTYFSTVDPPKHAGLGCVIWLDHLVPEDM